MEVPRIRRVITGHDEQGKAVVQIDEVCTHFRENRPKGFSCVIWSTDTSPADNTREGDAGQPGVKVTTMPDGTVFRILDFRPGVAERVHRTDTIDYVVVMQGEIDMELESGEEIHLRQGDVMVQRGTVHNWINRGTETCVMAVVLVGAKPVTVGGEPLKAFG